MKQTDADVYLENERLKNEFKALDLILDDVMDFTPYNLVLENKKLESLLLYTQDFLEHRSRKLMELKNKPFPPIFPGISPDNDWERFLRWIDKKATRQIFKDRLPAGTLLPSPDSLSDDEIDQKVAEIINLLEKAGTGVSLQTKLPNRLVYHDLLEYLEEEDLFGMGWSFDGCSGYCPGCIQRPWCESGQQLWQEDLDSDRIKFIDPTKQFVSPLPFSQKTRQKAKAEMDRENAEMEAIRQERKSKPSTTVELPKTGDELFDLNQN